MAACTEDHHTPPAAAQPLPPGAYPLQIASLTVSADTRLADNGNTTSWQPDDQVMVSLGDRQAVYTYNADGTWHSDTPLCWESTAPQTVNAWYPVADEIDFTHQDQGLTYLLKADPVPATYDDPQPLNLTFRHQLAKVRVLLDGTKATEVASVTVRNYPQSAHNQGTLGSSIGTPIYVPMLKTTYEGKPCWEATLRPGSFEADNTFEVAKEGGFPVRVTLAKEKIPVIAGQVTTITINVNPAIPEGTPVLPDATGDISGTDAYVVRGNNRTTPINITGGSPTIYLDGATVAVSSGNAINITGGNPTIYVVGENNNISTSKGAGIYVAEGSTVTITGSSRDDELIVRGGNGRPGIGGCIADNDYEGVSCGNINISNITVSAYGSTINNLGFHEAPGIGSVGSVTCGTITISSATVHAFGIESNPYSTPGIGCGYTSTENPKSIPDVIASNSEIHAHRGDPGGTCDYIGWAADLDDPSSTYANSTITPGAGSIKSSTVYCYTGETLDKTMVYDGSGVGTEQQ